MTTTIETQAFAITETHTNAMFEAQVTTASEIQATTMNETKITAKSQTDEEKQIKAGTKSIDINCNSTEKEIESINNRSQINSSSMTFTGISTKMSQYVSLIL